MPTDADRDQDLTRVVGMIRDAIERAFDMTLPSSRVEVIVQAIYDMAADQPRRQASTPATDEVKTRSAFQYRIDRG